MLLPILVSLNCEISLWLFVQVVGRAVKLA